jgi:hypothetical protein
MSLTIFVGYHRRQKKAGHYRSREHRAEGTSLCKRADNSRQRFRAGILHDYASLENVTSVVAEQRRMVQQLTLFGEFFSQTAQQAGTYSNGKTREMGLSQAAGRSERIL